MFGNYISLTNLKERDVKRILEMHISPMNVSVHTTDPALRCKMLSNRFAGESLRYLADFVNNGIRINCQLVLCPHLNDGAALRRTLEDLGKLGENLLSIACVPVGITAYREKLYPLIPYDKERASETLDIVEEFGARFTRERGVRTVYASDEFYLLAERPIPEASYYEDFPQIENGVGMMASMEEEFAYALEEPLPFKGKRRITSVTGEAAAPYIEGLLSRVREKYAGFSYQVISVKNAFFGGTVNVAGLLTGGDMIRALQGKELGDEVLIPASTLRHEGDIFLDDVSLTEMEEKIRKKVTPVPNDGEAFLRAALGLKE